MEVSQSLDNWVPRGVREARRSPRFKLKANIRVYPRNRAVVRGHTVDISESGIAAMLMDEIPVSEIVRLEFSLPDGDVEVMAIVRHHTAFRYGFEFIEDGPVRNLIARTCRELAIEQSLDPSPAH